MVLLSVATRIEKMQRDFLWSRIGEGKRDHLVRWDQVCKPMENSGLGFMSISFGNKVYRALLGKWLWRFFMERTIIWNKVILSIYKTHLNSLDANILVRQSHCCPLKVFAQVFQDFSGYTQFNLGNVGKDLFSRRLVVWKSTSLFSISKSF